MVVDLYEPQNLALLVFGGFVVLSFVVYAVSAFGIQEKSYEQAVAEQRARIEKEQQHQREAKRQKRKPFFEKKKREREKQDSSPGILQQEVPVVQAFDSYVAEQPAPLPPSDVKSSPAKEEKTKVKPSPKKPKQPKPPKQAVIEETVVEDKAAPVEESIPPPKESHTTKSKPPKVVEEVVQKKAAPVVAAAAPSTQAAPPRPEEASPVKAKSKAKAPSGDADPSALRGKSLISAVKTAPLKDSEIQQLIEILLNRQGGSPSADDWVKANQRNDPVSALKKQLQEKEQALHNEMLLAQSASQKVKELRHELNQQREHSATVEGQFKLKFDTQAREIQAFKVRMQQSHESHTHEMQALQNLNKQLRAAQEESQPDVVAQLKEENNRLKSEANHSAQKKEQLMGAELARLQAELQKMQSKLSSNESQLRQGEEMRHALETQISQYQQQSQFDAGQRESESALSKRLMEVSEELRKAEAVNQSLNLAKDSANEEMEKVKGQLAERCRLDGDRTAALQAIQAKLSDSESKCNSLEGQVRDVKNLLEEKQQQKTQADQELEALKKENDSLQGQLQSREKRSEAEGQEAPPPASDSADHTDSGPKEETVLLKEHNSIVADKEKTIVGLEEQLSSSRTELEGLQAVVEQQKQRNNNLREKNRKLMEVVSAAEKTSAESATRAARAAKEDVSSALAQEQASTKTVLERLFPGVSLESSLAYKDWLSKFEKEAAQVLSKQSSTSSEAEEYALKINTLEAEKEQLSSQCQHYQSVLAETEGILNKLQNSVESEEVKWEERLKQTESSLGQAKGEVASLQDELDTLTSSTSQTSSENARLASELEEANATIGKLRQDQEAAASSYETTSQELVELKSQLHKLKEELEAANLRAGQSNDKEEENAETKNRLASSEAAVKRLETELQEARSGQTEATSLRKQLEESAAQLEAARATAQEAGKEVEALKAQLDGASKAAPASGEEDLAQARTALSKAEEKTAAQQKEISTLTESLKKEKALTQDLGKAAAKLQAMLKKTQSALNVEKETVAQLKMQNGAKEDALGSTSLTESQVELQLADAANEEAKQVDGTGV
ncbi:ribosome-binding protein 1-like isoform X5 [Diadema setosum]|uniref:ribosome-binding protein 1-like isoform X5 n=1 Tax=Diadema setosum TaxID=31175 RepID=UPI003B3A90DD